jgi:hypothetical protein
MGHDIKRISQRMKPGMVGVDVYVTIGASGAVTSYAGSVGVTSVAKSATGKYLVTMERGYADYHHTEGESIRASGDRLFFGVDSSYTAGSSTITIRTDIANGTATEPSSGDKLRFTMWFDELDIT